MGANGRVGGGSASEMVTGVPAVDLVVSAGPKGRIDEPVTWGMAWPRGRLQRSAHVVVRDAGGRRWPVQARALDRWPDGSIRWLLVDSKCELHGTTTVEIDIDPNADAHVDERLVVLEDQGISVDTGVARFHVSAGDPFLVASGSTEEQERFQPSRCRLTVEDAAGVAFRPRFDRVEIRERGPLRAGVRLEGKMVAGARPSLLDVFVHIEFFAGTPVVRAEITLRNSRRSHHPGGFWELGDEGSVLLRHASLHLEMAPGKEPILLECSPEPGQPFKAFPLPFELYQDSSGGENWRSPNHVNRHGVVPTSFQGYRIKAGTEVWSGLRANPTTLLHRGENHLGVGFRHFWQEFPKALEATTSGLTVRMFPPQFGDLHELQGGEQKTHRLFLAFGEDTITQEPLLWCRTPICPSVRPEWSCSTGAIPHLLPREEDPNQTYLSLVDQAIEGEQSFEQKREFIDEYGWRHFGDLYADHENVYYPGSKPLISHYNNQYDAIAGLIYQFLRDGDVRWWRLADELANHVVDIDIYHTDRDRSAYNRGLFWHTSHYVDAGRSTHRSYPKSEDSPGGGPSPEHNYTTGLMLHYLLTGNIHSREVVLGLAQWVIDVDDGRKTSLRWLSRGYTGLASATGSIDYHGPGRAPANSINALLDAHRLDGQRRYLDKAEQLILRCIHPADDIEARNLLNAERRWYYTVFLQVLGKYLDYKAELEEFDQRYAYGQMSLLRYAEWALRHEYPYLDKPEILEYPTETWAAQDMRKSEVFKFAAKHSRGERRARFLERSEFFFRYSTDRLLGTETRRFTRPVVLMLSHGWMHTYFASHPQLFAPAPTVEEEGFGEPERFVPQKTIAKRRMVGVFVATATTLLLLALSIFGVLF